MVDPLWMRAEDANPSSVGWGTPVALLWAPGCPSCGGVRRPWAADRAADSPPDLAERV